MFEIPAGVHLERKVRRSDRLPRLRWIKTDAQCNQLLNQCIHVGCLQQTRLVCDGETEHWYIGVVEKVQCHRFVHGISLIQWIYSVLHEAIRRDADNACRCGSPHRTGVASRDWFASPCSLQVQYSSRTDKNKRHQEEMVSKPFMGSLVHEQNDSISISFLRVTQLASA
jgi:hypothetical protein